MGDWEFCRFRQLKIFTRIISSENIVSQNSLTESTGIPPSRNAVLTLFRSNWSVEVPLPEEVKVGARKSPLLLNLATTNAPSDVPLPPPLRSTTPPPSTSTRPSNV